MRYYLLILILFTLLLTGKGLKEMNRAETPLPTPDTCETNTIKLDTIRGCIGSVKIDTLPVYKCNFPTWFYPSWNCKPIKWGEVIELN